jgi:hypothetical protein
MINYKATFLGVRKIYHKTRFLPWLMTKTKIYPKIRNYITWNLEWRKDTKSIGHLMGRSIPKEKPLLLNFEYIQEITTSLRNDLFNYNPTLVLHNKQLKIFWRISNCSTSPKTDWRGITKNVYPKIGKIEGIGTGELIFDSETISLINEEIAIPISSNHFEHLENPYPGFQSTLEDPRAICTDEILLLLNTCQIPNSGGDPRNGLMALYNCANKDLILLNLPEESSVQKNFTIINSNRNVIRLLKSSNPHTVLEFDKNNGNLVKKLENKQNNKSFLHGGSPFVLVDNEYYFRIARQRFNLKNLFKIHLSYLVMHDLTFNEIGRTKPFILQNYAYEICNGLVEIENNFHFSWGENDKKIYVGVISKRDLIRFFHENILI